MLRRGRSPRPSSAERSPHMPQVPMKATGGGLTGPPYTKKQGRYLAFIYYYTKLNGRPPAERDMQWYFRTTPPAVHDMVKALHERGLIERTPGKARSIRVALPRDELPDLE